MADTLVRMSASKAQTYAGCGWKYNLKYNEGVPQVPSVASLAGRAVHAYAHDLELFRLRLEPYPEPFSSYFDSELALAETTSGVDRSQFKVGGRRTKALPNGETIEYWRDELGPWMCQQLAAFDFGSEWSVATNLPPDADDRTVGLEYAVHLPDIPFVAYIDRIDVDQYGNYRVVDYKTGRARKSTQLQLYMAALKVLGVRAVYAAYFYTRKAQLDGPYSAAWSEQTFRDYLTVHQMGIRSALYIPNPGDQCSWCDVADHCRFRAGAV